MSQKAPFWANDLHNSAPRLNSVCSVTIPCALRAGERGLLWGRCPPSRPLSKPPNHPPYLALRLCVPCPPVPTKASLSEQAGAHIHPRMGGGMKLGQGCYPSCVPRPAAGGIAGVRARPEKPRAPGRRAQGITTRKTGIKRKISGVTPGAFQRQKSYFRRLARSMRLSRPASLSMPESSYASLPPGVKTRLRGMEVMFRPEAMSPASR